MNAPHARHFPDSGAGGFDRTGEKEARPPILFTEEVSSTSVILPSTNAKVTLVYSPDVADSMSESSSIELDTKSVLGVFDMGKSLDSLAGENIWSRFPSRQLPRKSYTRICLAKKLQKGLEHMISNHWLYNAIT